MSDTLSIQAKIVLTFPMHYFNGNILYVHCYIYEVLDKFKGRNDTSLKCNVFHLIDILWKTEHLQCNIKNLCIRN